MSRTGRVIINDIDIYTEYGARVDNAGYDSLIEYPPLKPVRSNNWVEEDGIEPDLSDIKLDSKEVTLKFHCLGVTSHVEGLYALLTSSPLIEISFAEISREFTLRVKSMPSLSYCKSFKTITVGFVAVNPLEWCTSDTPSSTLIANDSFKIDGVNISAYGVKVLRGSIDSSIICPDVKQLLVRNISTQDGETYDDNPRVYSGGQWSQSSVHGQVKKTSKEISLHLLLQAQNCAAAWINYDALLSKLVEINSHAQDITLAGARSLYIKELDRTVKCYYKGQSVQKFRLIAGRVWLEFTVTLVQFD